jgi:septum formation topological specificity factor MinE
MALLPRKSKVRPEQVERLRQSIIDVVHAYEGGGRPQIRRAQAVHQRAWDNSTQAEREAAGKRRKRRS